jgi:hypothetical protein
MRDFVENAPVDMRIQFGDNPAIEIKTATLEELVAAVVEARRIQKGANYMVKIAERALVKRLEATGESSVSVPGYDVIYDYPEKRLWDINELMDMAVGMGTTNVLETILARVTPGQLKALKDQFPDLEKIIEGAERIVAADKKRLEIEEVPVRMGEAKDE